MHDFRAQLRLASTAGASGRFAEMCSRCEALLSGTEEVERLLDIGALFVAHGFLTQAREVYDRAQRINPTDLRATVNLANVARDTGEHAEARCLYSDLLSHLPDHPVIRRNALTGLEYDPATTNAERLQHAREWGHWAMARAGGYRPRPVLKALTDRPLRLGYVSADFCQHTVGLFVKEVLNVGQ